ETGNTYRSVFRVVPEPGSTRWIRTIGATHVTPGGGAKILGVNWDVSEELQLKTSLIEAKRSAEGRTAALEEARQQMEHASLHDVLTGLPNRRFLDQKVFGSGSEVSPTALIHIDLDRFKQINDTLGHAAGDAMLVHAANVLRRNISRTDYVARVGGDEFVVITTDRIEKGWLEEFAGRVITQLSKPVVYHGHTCRFGASIGIAIADRDDVASSNSQMLIDADLALYRAKRRGRNRYEFFDASLKAEILSQKVLADEILQGLENQEFVPYFQPQFDAHTLDITGVEAVARWKHPSKGILTPEAFLGMAEELSVVQNIDRMILLKTLFQSKRWEAAGLHIPKKSVNVSAGHLSDPDLMNLLNGLPITPGELSFELLESIFLDEENETVTQNIESLSGLGIDIEIDDFGTGHASIVGLLHLNPSRLKIERRLIKPIVECSRQRRIVSSIIEIGMSLGIDVVAEGVETMEHVAILRDLGCSSLQGFALAKPMPTNDFIQFALGENWRKNAA
ncbi:MAG: EAL domain-containing protein, partial [Pseudomonadota bacterium]